jgi:hypothetical protein
MILKLLNTYKRIAHAQLGSRDTILYRDDLWNGRILKHDFPQLHSFALNKNIKVQSVLGQDNLQSIFQLPNQFCELHIIMQNIQMNGDKDS